jgi:hypothetical protein
VQLELSRVPLTNHIQLATLRLQVDLPQTQWRPLNHLALRPWVTQRLLPDRTNHTWIQALRLGTAVWFGTPCDFSGELALPIKAQLRLAGLAPTVTSFNGDYIGYVIPSHYYQLPGYEPRTMSFYGPGIPDYFTELIHRMAAKLDTSSPTAPH